MMTVLFALWPASFMTSIKGSNVIDIKRLPKTYLSVVMHLSGGEKENLKALIDLLTL